MDIHQDKPGSDSNTQTCGHPRNVHCRWPADMPGPTITCDVITARDMGGPTQCPCTTAHWA